MQIPYDLNQKSRDDLEIYSSFLTEVLTFIRSHEHFQRHFGFIENYFRLNLFEFHLVLGLGSIPISSFMKIKHDAWMQCKDKQGLNWGCDNSPPLNKNLVLRFKRRVR